MALERVQGGLDSLRGYDESLVRAPVERVAPEEVRPLGSEPGSQRGREGGRADVPEGTDPRVWLGLSAEERSFFARIEAAGPLAYGATRMGAGEAAYRGRYIHIKV